MGGRGGFERARWQNICLRFFSVLAEQFLRRRRPYPPPTPLRSELETHCRVFSRLQVVSRMGGERFMGCAFSLKETITFNQGDIRLIWFHLCAHGLLLLCTNRLFSRNPQCEGTHCCVSQCVRVHLRVHVRGQRVFVFEIKRKPAEVV